MNDQIILTTAGKEKILAELPPEGLFMRTYVGSQAEADQMLKDVTRWSASKNVFAAG